MSSKSIMESNGGLSNITASGFEYEVFLSFRGPDTRSCFTDHLYVRLIDAGIRAYRDDEELRKGENIGSELLKAINDSKIAIPIFSKNYAASKWCLKELAQMVECKRSNGLKVMPIFYDVSPFKVRHQTEDYAEAFERHEKCHDEDTIKSWKAALKEVGELSGWDLHASTSRFFEKEGELVKEITRVVLQELKKSYLVVTDYLVGVEDHAKEILGMLSADVNAVQIFGIHGMGGIGKTTLAKVIYNHFLPNFEDHSFLADVRETYQSKGMEFLYKKLISDILGKQSADISNVDEGIRIIRERFSRKKVIILLDDVDEISQLHIIGKRDWFGHGSRIIITTRNKSILDSFQVDWSYEIGGLETHLALKLFSKHAFRKDNPPEKYSKFSQKVVQIAGGLPLALEVFGSLLCGKSSEGWDSTLKQIEKVSHKDILSKLEISFEALNDQEKQIFLDIASFFIGEDYALVIHFWEESKFPRQAMEFLQQLSLIKIKGQRIWMHDQLRDLGREIVQGEREKCNRLWNEEEATGLFMSNKVDENIQGICLDMRKQSRHQFKSVKFANLPNLRLLRVKFDPFFVEAKNFKSILKDCLGRGHPFIFSELRWLSLHRFWRMRFTRNITFRKLAILDLSYSDIKSSWNGWSHIKMAKNLKVLNLTGCKQLLKIPDLSCHPLLEQLILVRCYELVEIDKSISELKHLVIINLRGCRRLKKLPEELSCMESLEELNIEETSIVEIPGWPLMRRLRVFYFFPYQLKKVSSLNFAVNLRELSFSNSSITKLPDSIGKLVNLLELSLQGCKGIKTLPESIGDLVSLVELDLEESGIVELPNTIGNLRNVKRLAINSTPLRRLPTEIGKLLNLLELSLEGCKGIKTLPESIGDLVSLVELDLEKSGIVELPNTIGNLRNLKRLAINSTPLRRLPTEIGKLVNLLELSLERCNGIKTLPESIGDLVSLVVLNLKESGIFKLPNTIGNLRNLKTLGITSIPLTRLPTEIGMMENLMSIIAGYCSKLHDIPKLPQSLLELKVSEARTSRIPDLSNLINLKKLELFLDDKPVDLLEEGCSAPWWIGRVINLKTLILRSKRIISLHEDLGMLSHLRTLELFSCSELRSVSKLPLGLTRLKIVNCTSLTTLMDLPSSLTSLRITGCRSLETLSNFSHLKKPTFMAIDNTPIRTLKGLHSHELQKSFLSRGEISEIDDLDMLENLDNLYIDSCVNLQSLPDLSSLKKLKDLYVRSCPNLVEIPGIDMLENLDKLSIKYCAKLQSLPDLSSLKKLKDLEVQSFPNLVEIPSIDMLENLEKLYIEECANLQCLPDLSNLKKLKNLRVSSCHNLVEILGIDMLENLKKLSIVYCAKLQSFPDLSNLKILFDLRVQFCPNLVNR